jgi:hypothetical protein
MVAALGIAERMSPSAPDVILMTGSFEGALKLEIHTSMKTFERLRFGIAVGLKNKAPTVVRFGGQKFWRIGSSVILSV